MIKLNTIKKIVSVALVGLGIYLGLILNYENTSTKILGIIAAGLNTSLGIYLWRLKIGLIALPVGEESTLGDALQRIEDENTNVEKHNFKPTEKERQDTIKGTAPVLSVEAYFKPGIGLVIDLKKSNISVGQAKDIVRRVLTTLEKENPND